MASMSYFTAHPESEGETYSEHFAVAFGFSRQLIGAGIAAAIHAVLPNFHTTTASRRIHQLHHCLESGDREAIKKPGSFVSPCAEELSAAS